MVKELNKWIEKRYKLRVGWVGLWTFEHFDRKGNLIWKHRAFNALADEGEENMLDLYLRGQNAPTTFFLRLYNDTPAETDTLSDLTGEPSSNGYAAQEIPRDTNGWPTLVLDGGDFQATSSQETFVASGGSWGPVTNAVLATSTGTSGKLVAFVALSASRTVNDGESIKITLDVKLS